MGKKIKFYEPKIGRQVYVDPSAQIIGRVKIGDYSSIWPCVVIRGDINRISVGRYTNIQDLSLLHVETNRGCHVGDYVTVGHQVTLHACTIKDQCLIGMGSIIMDGAVVGEGTLLAAGSLLTHGQKLKSGSLYMGRPAKWVRFLSKKEIVGLKSWAKSYIRYAKEHRERRFGRVIS